jgi:hypothetical protein
MKWLDVEAGVELWKLTKWKVELLPLFRFISKTYCLAIV